MRMIMESMGSSLLNLHTADGKFTNDNQEGV